MRAGKFSLTSGAVCVLCLFVLTEPTTAEPAADPGPQDQGETKRGRLLGLVRRILDYGRDLVATLQRQNTPTPGMEVARRFGTFNLALIIARITRGLALAARLELRLGRTPPTQSAAATNAERAPARPRTTRPRPPALTPSEDDAALLRALPSAEEIAARVRNRPVGAVIVDICRDLGIDASHELWPEIRDAIIQYGGSLARMLMLWVSRIPGLLAGMRGDEAAPPPPAWQGPLATSTGPP